MLHGVRALLGRLSREDRVDLCLAALLGAVATAATVTESLGTDGNWAAAAWGVVAVAPLAVRRRFPLASWVAVLAVIAAQATVTGSNDGAGVFFGLLVGGYSVAAHTPRRSAVLALLLLVPVLAYCSWVTTGRWFDDVAFVVTLVGGFWFVGRVVHSRDQLVRRLADQADELRRSRDAAARAVAVEQRTRIARDVHDVVAHSVSLMVVQAEAGEAQLPADGPSAECLRAIQRVGRSTMTELRGLLATLGEDSRPDPAHRLRDADLLAGDLRAAGLAIDLRVEGTTEHLPPGVDLAAYRILQEALTNALRHGQGGPVRACVVAGRGEVVVDVVSAGGRAAFPDVTAGRGLVGMRERARLYGGEVETGLTDEGFQVRARIPVPTAARVPG